VEQVYPVLVASQYDLWSCKIFWIVKLNFSQDFQSRNGLFSVPRAKRERKATFKDIFDSRCADTPEWNKFMGQLHKTIAGVTITDTHGFLWVLHCKHKLQRIYTQNIDALE
jgi:NAD-dependent SIR2 family protein deacetylase